VTARAHCGEAIRSDRFHRRDGVVDQKGRFGTSCMPRTPGLL
jgi:hypothetical protein